MTTKRHHSFGLHPSEREEFERVAYRACVPFETEIRDLGCQLDSGEISAHEYGYRVNLLYVRIGEIRNAIYAEFETKYLNFD